MKKPYVGLKVLLNCSNSWRLKSFRTFLESTRSKMYHIATSQTASGRVELTVDASQHIDASKTTWAQNWSWLHHSVFGNFGNNKANTYKKLVCTYHLVLDLIRYLLTTYIIIFFKYRTFLATWNVCIVKEYLLNM